MSTSRATGSRPGSRSPATGATTRAKPSPLTPWTNAATRVTASSSTAAHSITPDPPPSPARVTAAAASRRARRRNASRSKSGGHPSTSRGRPATATTSMRSRLPRRTSSQTRSRDETSSGTSRFDQQVVGGQARGDPSRPRAPGRARRPRPGCRRAATAARGPRTGRRPPSPSRAAARSPRRRATGTRPRGCRPCPAPSARRAPPAGWPARRVALPEGGHRVVRHRRPAVAQQQGLLRVSRVVCAASSHGPTAPASSRYSSGRRPRVTRDRSTPTRCSLTCTCNGTCRSRQSSTSALRVGSDTDSGTGTATEPCTRSRPATASRCRLARVQAWSGESASAPSVQATASTQRSPSSAVASATGPGPCRRPGPGVRDGGETTAQRLQRRELRGGAHLLLGEGALERLPHPAEDLRRLAERVGRAERLGEVVVGVDEARHEQPAGRGHDGQFGVRRLPAGPAARTAVNRPPSTTAAQPDRGVMSSSSSSGAIR